MGATLDIQRQQRMDLLDQQLLLAQYNEARRNARQQPQVDGHTHTNLSLQWSTFNSNIRNQFTSIRLHVVSTIVCVQPGLLQWTRLFPSLRHRGQNRPPMQPRPQAQTQPSTQAPLLDNSPVAEEQVGVSPRVPLHANTWAALHYYTGLMHFFLFSHIFYDQHDSETENQTCL